MRCMQGAHCLSFLSVLVECLVLRKTTTIAVIEKFSFGSKLYISLFRKTRDTYPNSRFSIFVAISKLSWVGLVWS